MKFMLMMNAPRGKGAGDYGVVNWALEDFTGGTPINMAIEVREVMSAPDV